MVNILLIGFFELKTFGSAPFDRSAIILAAKSSAALIASAGDAPLSISSRYFARVIVSEVNSSIHFIGDDKISCHFSVPDFQSTSLPFLFVKKTEASAKLSGRTLLFIVCAMPFMRFTCFTSPACTIGMRLVSQDAGFKETILAATRFSIAFEEL